MPSKALKPLPYTILRPSEKDQEQRLLSAWEFKDQLTNKHMVSTLRPEVLLHYWW